MSIQFPPALRAGQRVALVSPARKSSAAELARSIQLFDFVMIGLVIFVWMLVLTVTIGCVIVWLMKGPAYVADGYEVSHSDKPKP